MSDQRNVEERTVPGAVLAAMQDNGWIRSDGYRLHDGFNTTLTIKKVRTAKSRNSNKLDNFRVICDTEGGKETLPGSVLVNARVLADAEITANPYKAGIWMRSEIEDTIMASQIFNEHQSIADADYVFPESIQVVGAVVDEDPDIAGKPRFPLRSFKYYNKVLAHHRKEMNDKDAFMTRDEFKEYIALEDKRPSGVPETYKSLELLDSIKPDEAKNWAFTLLLADPSK